MQLVLLGSLPECVLHGLPVKSWYNLRKKYFHNEEKEITQQEKILTTGENSHNKRKFSQQEKSQKTVILKIVSLSNQINQQFLYIPFLYH